MNRPEAKETNEKNAPEAQQPENPLAEQLAAAQKDAADNRDRYLRALADLDNFRKRTIREKDELRQFGSQELLEDLLPALDSLALGIASARHPNAELKTVVEGLVLSQQQLKAALAAHDLKEINPVGEAFDPHRHEAISHEPSKEVPAEHIIKVVRTGYLLNERLLRPASVIVSSGSPEKEAAR
ncbi:MAG TPA: nucleotide exchange factor GrpE [Opitutaceae bacterium]|jgi:molecular chaperone GrpE